jgi:hypothetical protein
MKGNDLTPSILGSTSNPGKALFGHDHLSD